MSAESSRVGPEQHEDDLLELLAGIALELSEAETLQATMQRVVDLAEQLIVACHGASLMLISKGGMIETPAHSSRTALDSDRAQYETGEGPCLDAIRDEPRVVLNDLQADRRWPAYRARASELGIGSMLAFRLFVSGDTIGALNLYSREVDAFDMRSQVVGQVFAMHASVALKASLTEAALDTMLRSRDVIGQAKGIIMARRRMTADMAFEALRDLSQRRNQRIHELAQKIAETGEIP